MAASAFAIVVVLLMTVWDSMNPTAELIGIPHAQPPYARPGDVVEIKWGTFVKHRECAGRITRVLEDGSRITLSPSVSTVPVGSYPDFTTTVTLPPYLPPGEWYYRVSIEYRCFPWTWHKSDFPPVPITVLP